MADPSQRSRAALALKRLIDVLGALLGLAVALPLMALIASAIRVFMGAPVLFRQVRPGLHERPFTLLKFRTMRSPQPDDEKGWHRSDTMRLTPLGRFLRRFSLDEVPQLVNVLRGDMSLVGPRPLLPEYLPRYTDDQRRRHTVRPGISGLAAVAGRQRIPFSRRLELDLEYVDNWSLALDFRILLRTLIRALGGTGVISGQEIDEVDDLALASDLDLAAEAVSKARSPTPAKPLLDKVELLAPEDARWRQVLHELPHDVYHLPEYVALEARRVDGEALAFLAEGDGFRLFVPLALIDIPGGRGRDAASPYGYPGPITFTDLSAERSQETSAAAYGVMLRLLQERSVVSLFIRLHPLLSRSDLLPINRGHLVDHGHTVSIDLTLPEERQWAQVRANHRRQIRRAREAGLETEIDSAGDYLAEFEGLYLETMHRVRARADYFFPPDYLAALWARLHDRLVVAAVRFEGQIVCAGLFSRTEAILQYLFGGTRTDALDRHPSKLMFDDVRHWGAEQGLREFHLGGGLGGREDDLFHFKAGFSDRRFLYQTWRCVVDERAYRQLLGLGQEDQLQLDGFFPAYKDSSRRRATITTSI